MRPGLDIEEVWVYIHYLAADDWVQSMIFVATKSGAIKAGG